MKYFIVTLLLMFSLYAFGTQGTKVSDENLVDALVDVMRELRQLEEGAVGTMLRHSSAIRKGKVEESNEIPKEFWSKELIKKRPIRIYKHGKNLVVVQRDTEEKEIGLYIVTRFSKSTPSSGDEGYVFLQDTSVSVLNYERIKD